MPRRGVRDRFPADQIDTAKVTTNPSGASRLRRCVPRIACAVVAIALTALVVPAIAQDDARTKQLRLLCAQLSGDLTDPGGIAAFRRCLTARSPVDEIRKDNNIGHVPQGNRTGVRLVNGQQTLVDRPNAVPPAGFGRNSRKSLADGVDHFQTIDGKVFFAIDKDAKLWRWTAGTKDARTIDQGISSFVVSVDGTLYVKDIRGGLWREGNGPATRGLVDRGVANFQPLNATLIYVQGNDGTLTREGADPGKRAVVDRAVSAFQAVDASVVFVLGTDHKLWRETGDMRTRTLVAANIAFLQYIPDGDTMYVQTLDAGLWRQQGKDKPEAVDTSVAAFQAVDMHLAFVLGNDGRLWQELGNREHAVLVDHNLLVAQGRSSFHALDQHHVDVLGDDRKLWAETMPPGR